MYPLYGFNCDANFWALLALVFSAEGKTECDIMNRWSKGDKERMIERSHGYLLAQELEHEKALEIAFQT